jgi:hypothetical protein
LIERHAREPWRRVAPVAGCLDELGPAVNPGDPPYAFESREVPANGCGGGVEPGFEIAIGYETRLAEGVEYQLFALLCMH